MLALCGQYMYLSKLHAEHVLVEAKLLEVCESVGPFEVVRGSRVGGFEDVGLKRWVVEYRVEPKVR